MNELAILGLAILAVWLTWCLNDTVYEHIRKLRLDNDLKELELIRRKKELSS
jgi:hypothetical protein